MIHVIQFSGGAASALVAKLVAEEYGKENVVLLHHDTKAEDPDTYRFLKQVSNRIGVPVVDVSDGRSLWEVIEDNKAIPSDRMPFCTRILKQEPGEYYFRWLERLGIEYTMYNGFGPDEWSRVQRAVIRAEAAGRKLKCPLFEQNIGGEEVKRIIREDWKICLPNAYKTMKHNNCIPCFKAGKASWRKVWEFYPEQFSKAVEMEKKFGHTVFKDASLEELSRLWEANQMPSLWEDDGIPCMCAI